MSRQRNKYIKCIVIINAIYCSYLAKSAILKQPYTTEQCKHIPDVTSALHQATGGKKEQCLTSFSLLNWVGSFLRLLKCI